MCTLPFLPAEKSIPLRILYEKYRDCLTESNLIKVRGLLVEQAANSYLLAERDIYLENPEIKIRVRGRLGRVGGRARAQDKPRTGKGQASRTHLHPCTLKIFEVSGSLKFWLHQRKAP